jgi:hypothetical protein
MPVAEAFGVLAATWESIAKPAFHKVLPTREACFSQKTKVHFAPRKFCRFGWETTIRRQILGSQSIGRC